MVDTTKLVLATEFLCRTGVIDATPAVGEHLNRWRIIGCWVDGKGYIKGYQLKCDTCGTVRQYVSVFDARAKQIRYCQHLIPLAGVPKSE